MVPIVGRARNIRIFIRLWWFLQFMQKLQNTLSCSFIRRLMRERVKESNSVFSCETYFKHKKNIVMKYIILSRLPSTMCVYNVNLLYIVCMKCCGAVLFRKT